MNNFAPILIPTLNRHVHFKRCVESLSACTHADKSDFFIALDFPLKDAHWEGYNIIKNYVPTISGFKSVKVIEREKNYGAVDNFFKAIEYIFARYDRLIFSEDDNVFSTNFLEYINKGLENYENEENVLAICGYNYPIKMPSQMKEDVYFWKGFSGWGFGTWKNKWENIDWNTENLGEYLNDENNIKKLNQVAGHLYPHLQKILDKGHITGDTIISYNLVKNDMYSVFPKISKVRNMGHDGSGVHCGYSNLYFMQKIDDGKNRIKFTKDIKEDEKINALLRKHFSRSLYARIIRKIKKIIGMKKSE